MSDEHEEVRTKCAMLQKPVPRVKRPNAVNRPAQHLNASLNEKEICQRNLTCSASRQATQSVIIAYEPLVNRQGTITAQTSAAFIPDQALCEELVELYFRYIHVSFPNIFHQATFTAAVKDGSVPKILFFGVIALSARFSSHQSLAGIDVWARGRPYAREAERLLDLHEISLTTVQACILLAANFVNEGEPSTESIYYAIACRMAMLIDLPNVPVMTQIEREVNRRVWWSLITSDTWISSALCLPRTIKPREEVPLPMSELTFAQLQPGDLAELGPSIDITLTEREDVHFSVLAHMVRLNSLLNDINNLCVTIVAEQPNTETAENLIHPLSMSLDDWVSQMPPQMQYTEANLKYWAGKGFGRIFISLHINYNHAGQLLFYQFLHLSETAAEEMPVNSAQINARKCKSHAANICKIVSQAKERPDTDVLYSLLGHVLVLASTTQLHTVLFSADNKEISMAKSRLESNFEALTTLRSYWPVVSASIGRLRAFHNACLKSTNSSFRLDRWMLQFILEFSKPIEEKIEDSDSRERDQLALNRLRQSLKT
ncbi:hypothetical protein AUP68_17035 [Ilyonectria robusta]